MIADNAISDILNAPLAPDWTIAELAEQILNAIARQPSTAQEFVLVINNSTPSQPRRLVRPLLAYLATKSAEEAGTPANLYAGHLSFKRQDSAGMQWIVGEFENRPGNIRLTLRRSDTPILPDESTPPVTERHDATEGEPILESSR